MTNEDYQCPSCKVVISNNHENPQIIRPQRSNCPYCGSRLDLRGRSRRYKCITYMLNYKFFNNFFFFKRLSVKVEEEAVRLQTPQQRMRRSASASLPALNQRDHAVGGFLITSLGRVTLGNIFLILIVENII